MAKCPKCGSEDYTVIYVADTEYDYDRIITIGEAECEDCKAIFWVKEFFEFKNSINTKG